MMLTSEVIILLVVLIIGVCLWLAYSTKQYLNNRHSGEHMFLKGESTDNRNTKISLRTMRATFAWWDFGYLESVFKEYPWVIDITSWYAWGTEEYPSYEQVLYWETSHRMAIQIEYDPELISYLNLLDMYRYSIDPSDEWGQWESRWFQFGTALYYHTKEQKVLCDETFDAQEYSKRYGKPLVTEILPYTTFFLEEKLVIID